MLRQILIISPAKEMTCITLQTSDSVAIVSIVLKLLKKKRVGATEREAGWGKLISNELVETIAGIIPMWREAGFLLCNIFRL